MIILRWKTSTGVQMHVPFVDKSDMFCSVWIKHLRMGESKCSTNEGTTGRIIFGESKSANICRYWYLLDTYCPLVYCSLATCFLWRSVLRTAPSTMNSWWLIQIHSQSFLDCLWDIFFLHPKWGLSELRKPKFILIPHQKAAMEISTSKICGYLWVCVG